MSDHEWYQCPCGRNHAAGVVCAIGRKAGRTFAQPASSARDAAFANLTKALEAYTALLPTKPEPTCPPNIAPTLRHTSPRSFHLGFNMMLDAGGFMPGKIPVVVVPARPEDLKRYARKRTVRALLAAMGLSPNEKGQR